MSNEIDLTQHTGFIHRLMWRWKIPEQDLEDTYQDFIAYYLSYAVYDSEKGSPTTFLGIIFRNFMGTVRLKAVSQQALLGATHIEERDKEYLDRELGGYDLSVDDEIYIQELLNQMDDVTASIVRGEETCKTQAEKEGVTVQAIHQRHKRRLKNITGE